MKLFDFELSCKHFSKLRKIYSIIYVVLEWDMWTHIFNCKTDKKKRKKEKKKKKKKKKFDWSKFKEFFTTL